MRTGFDKWKERVYDRTFRNVCHQVRERRKQDPRLTKGELRRQMQTAYARQGSNRLGRGSLHEVELSATIAAYEHILAEWDRGSERHFHSDCS